MRAQGVEGVDGEDLFVEDCSEDAGSLMGYGFQSGRGGVRVAEFEFGCEAGDFAIGDAAGDELNM